MSRTIRIVAFLFAGTCLCVLAGTVASQQAKKTDAAPRLEAIADTKLLMVGLAKSNMDGLGKTLKDRPADAEAWGYVRGQALLIAETGNLLLMRPPKTRQAQDSWMIFSVSLRDAGVKVAKAAAAKDYPAAAPPSPVCPTYATIATKPSESPSASCRSPIEHHDSFGQRAICREWT